MKKYGYYTPIELAKNILQLVPDIEIESIIDICCGSWNLLRAAREKYSKASITGIDIDRDSEYYKIEGAEFYNEDGREFALKQKWEGRTYDLILSNPPFGYLAENSRKYNEKNFSEEQCYSGLISKRYEAEMTQANLFLTHENSILLFILPNTFVVGETLRKARRQISNDYEICEIIKLPSNTFEKGKINTFAIIMRKGVLEKHPTNLYEANNEEKWNIKKVGEMAHSDIIDGKWWIESNYRETCVKTNIYRGNLSSGDFESSGEKVLHNASKGKYTWRPSIRYYNEQKVKSKIVWANKGDILVNRIGKSAGYWCTNSCQDIAVSDCIIVVKNVSDNLIKKFMENSDADGRLKIPFRGVATPYITAQDVKRIVNN